jgi:hypothetical protein
MSVLNIREGEIPFVVFQPAVQRLADENSLQYPAQRETLRKARVLNLNESWFDQRAEYLGLGEPVRFGTKGGEWKGHFGRVRIPRIEGEPLELSIGTGFYNVSSNPLDGRHALVGVSKDPEKTSNHVRSELEAITEKLIERPLLTRLMDNEVGRYFGTYPGAVFASAAALDMVFTLTTLALNPDGGLNIEEARSLLTSAPGLVASGFGGLIVGLPVTDFVNRRIDQSRERALEKAIPNLGEYFADKVAENKLLELENYSRRQRVRQEALSGLQGIDEPVTPAEFRYLYSHLQTLDEGRTVIEARQEELPSVTQQPKPTAASESIVKALSDFRQIRGDLQIVPLVQLPQ